MSKVYHLETDRGFLGTDISGFLRFDLPEDAGFVFPTLDCGSLLYYKGIIERETDGRYGNILYPRSESGLWGIDLVAPFLPEPTPIIWSPHITPNGPQKVLTVPEGDQTFFSREIFANAVKILISMSPLLLDVNGIVSSMPAKTVSATVRQFQ